MNKAQSFLFDSRTEAVADVGKDVLRVAYGSLSSLGGIQKLWGAVDLSNVTNTVKNSLDSKLEVVSEAMAVGTQSTAQVLGRVGRVVGDDVSKASDGVSKFIYSKKGLAMAAEGMKDGFSDASTALAKAADFTKDKIKKGAKDTAKGIANKIYNSDWEEEGEYEPPKIVGLPSTDQYFLSVDEKQQQEGLSSLTYYLSVSCLTFVSLRFLTSFVSRTREQVLHQDWNASERLVKATSEAVAQGSDDKGATGHRDEP